jgi:hypothetical protein
MGYLKFMLWLFNFATLGACRKYYALAIIIILMLHSINPSYSLGNKKIWKGK